MQQTDNIEIYRVAMIEELGFTTDEATALAESYYDVTVVNQKTKVGRIYKMRVDHHYVRKLLDTGATREQVLAICV